MLDNLRKHVQSSDAVLGIGLLFILVLIIIPLPGYILDGLITLSFFVAILIIMTSLASKNPADFSVFPTLLLITTIYRLALNVSTTRMILTKGSASTSSIIEVFGTFVVGGGTDTGGYVIGVIIFLILTLVQVLVITKGATRVSEVAARFALDSLPGKQLAIDSDLAAGYINEEEARKRREKLQKEMGFYGAMDGASKFVQGDVRFGLVMIGINIIGGLVVGTSIRGESLADALDIYTRFTIGDGLVSAIPALLISSATGIIVSRSAGDESLPDDLKKELLSNPRTLYMAGGIIAASSLVPGLPFFVMLGMGSLIFYLGHRFEKSLQEDKSDPRYAKEQSAEKQPESYLQHLRSETLEVEIGYNLVPLVDKSTGGTLLDQISRLRKRFARERGLIVPPVRVRDNMNLQPNEYLIRLQGSQIGKAKVEPEKLMAIDTGRVTEKLTDESFPEPTYQLEAYWIALDQKSSAETAGYDVVDCSTVIATHLSKIIQKNSSEIMGRREVKSILDSLREHDPIIVDEVLSPERKINIGMIQAVLQNLLREDVAIRNMARILEIIADNSDRLQRDPYLLSETVRQNLRRQIMEDILDDKKELSCISIDPAAERLLRAGIHRDPEEGFVIALHPDFQEELHKALVEEYQKAQQAGHQPVFLCSSTVRAGVFRILERLLSSHYFHVLAHEEIPPDINVKVIGTVKAAEKTSVPVGAAT